MSNVVRVTESASAIRAVGTRLGSRSNAQIEGGVWARFLRYRARMEGS
jgi:hypothetical protein